MLDTTIKVETKDIANAISILASGQLKLENIRTIKDRDGETHAIQMGLFSHTVACGENGHTFAAQKNNTRINLINGSFVVVALTTKETAEELGLKEKD